MCVSFFKTENYQKNMGETEERGGGVLRSEGLKGNNGIGGLNLGWESGV